MCTLTIFPSKEGLIITMNRDENRNRGEGADLIEDKNRIYPYDTKSKGTWFGISKNNFAIALLNRYQDNIKNTTLSRGRFIPQLLLEQNIKSILNKFKQIHDINDNPFDLFIIFMDKIINIKWDGNVLNQIEYKTYSPLFFTSSSERFKEVFEFRRQSFEKFIKKNNKIDSDLILNDLHLYKESSDKKSAILMSRKLTHTKSICQFILNNDKKNILSRFNQCQSN